MFNRSASRSGPSFSKASSIMISRNQNKEIPIQGVKAHDFQNFLLAIYPTRQQISSHNLTTMIELSFRFLAPGVLDMCREVIDKEFDYLDKIELLEVSFRCDFYNIKERAAAYI